MNNIRHRGRSLVELMIALFIGLLILGAITSLLVQNKQSYRVTDDKSRLEEEGRLALNLMAFHIRMAGYAEFNSAYLTMSNYSNFVDETEPTQMALPVQGCDGSFVDPKASPIACQMGGSHSFLVRYFTDVYNTNQSGTLAPTDCLGAAITKNPAIAENRFYVASNGTRNELYCAGNGNTPNGVLMLQNNPQPIAENVENMKISYGFGFKYGLAAGESGSDTQNVDRYIDATTVNTLPLIKLEDVSDESPWTRVTSVKVCLIMRSANDFVVTKPVSYNDCDGVLKTATDRRLYQAFSTVVAIRSRTTGGAL